jgi:hemerythrin
MSDENAEEPARQALWSDDLKLSIPLIDGQHRNLVARLESLLEALGSRRPASALRESLHFLDSYAREHFHTEERFMKEHGFPGLEAHAGLHRHFRETVHKAEEFIRANPDSEKSLRLVKSVLANWYVQHIRGTDQEYAIYCRNKGTR